MKNRYSKVIGYFAYAQRNIIVCSDRACLVVGSENNMVKYLQELDPSSWNKNTIKKVRFGEIVQGMKLGGSYAFDQEAYGRFYPLAREEGIPVEEADFDEGRAKGFRFFTVHPVGS